MLRFIRENKKKLILLMIICNAILICCLYFKTNKDEVITTSNMKASNTIDEYNQLLINTYLTKIIKASEKFYDEYYTITPIVNYYSVFVKEISSDKRTYYVTFKSQPYLGPHDTIGIDEITFSADYLGTIKLEKFNHIISYHLPINLKDLEKKIVPGKYGDE